MVKVNFYKGNKSTLPSTGLDDASLYFVEDSGELFKSVGTGLPLNKIGDILTDYADLVDLQAKNPAKKNKLYLTQDGNLYKYTGTEYKTLDVELEPLKKTAYTIQATSNGQSEIKIPLTQYDPTKYIELVFKNTTKLPESDYTIVPVNPLDLSLGYNIVLTNPVTDYLNTYFNIILIHGVGQGGNVSGHELELVSSQNGVHGLRYWLGKLQESTDGGVTWNDITTGSGGGGITLPISANDVTELPSKVFVTNAEKSQITANQMDINGVAMRVTDVESQLANIVSTDEKVKMNALDAVAGYLEDKIDGSTIQNVGNKLLVRGIDGLTASIMELNLLTGATSNIQAQIDSLTRVGNFTTTVMTHADLMNIVSPVTNDMVIVLSDETLVDSPSSIYIYNGTQWVYSGKFESGQLRDFTTNPINLDTETSGILQKSKYEKQNALETPFTDSSGNISSLNTQDAIKELFQFADSGKTKISTAVGSPLLKTDSFDIMSSKILQEKTKLANAISLKGVATYNYNTFEEMANKILYIPNIKVEVGLNKIQKLNVSAPYTLSIALNNPIQLNDIAVTPIEFVAGAVGIVHYNLEFDNADKSDFVQNEFIEFDGYMKLNHFYEYNLVKDESWLDSGNLSYFEFDSSIYSTVNKLDSNK